MEILPYALYTAVQIRELDRLAIEEEGISGAILMARSAAAAFAELRHHWPQARRILVLCGAGNNAGDGYLLAKLAREQGLAVCVYALSDPSALRGDAADAWRQAVEAGVDIRKRHGEVPAGLGDELAAADVVVDGLLGTGLTGEVREPWRSLIDTINAARRPLLALDIPSGLDADRGVVLGSALRAELTVTFIGLKAGLFTGQGPNLCGELRYADLQVPESVFERVVPVVRRLQLSAMHGLLAPRRRDSHKGDFGHVLVVGGEQGMGGAARIAAEAAARSGAGLVSVAARAANRTLIGSGRPELMVHAVEEAAGLRGLLRRASVLAVGPGLGRGEWGQALLGEVLQRGLPMVLDADALNLLAVQPESDKFSPEQVLTPHPGEAGRLLGCSSSEVQADRFAAVRELQSRYGGVWVLKGAGTLMADSEGAIALCSAGNPGMASGGMGDFLTGIIAGLMAQGMTGDEAARLAVCLHAEAADRAAAEDGERGLLASDLLIPLRRLLNPGHEDG